MRLKVYLAGPEVFLPNALEHADVQRDLCLKYGFEPLHPMDNAIDLLMCDMQVASRLRRANIAQIEKCDIIVANCNPFRGICIDDGTAYEIGYANALKKKFYGYVKKLESLRERTIRDYPRRYDRPKRRHIDKEGYEIVQDFGTSINLMIECGGRLIKGNFEDCIAATRNDIDEYS